VTDGTSSGSAPCPAAVAGRWVAAVAVAAVGGVGASANSPSEVRRVAVAAVGGGGGGCAVDVRCCGRCCRQHR